MRLQTTDGAKAFDLTIVRYQFPELENDEWDSNWLVISVHVVTGERSWNFVNPCMLTMEAHDLANWLAFRSGPNHFSIFAADSWSAPSNRWP